jgi:hypothetical protein
MLLSKFHRLFRINGRARSLFLYGFFLNGLIRLSIAFVPVRRYAARLGELGVESPRVVTASNTDDLRMVLLTIRRVFRHAPWGQTCFSKAFTAKILLKRVGIQSTLYLGVARDSGRGLIAHAWLRCGEAIITGSGEMHQFTPMACFT